MALSAVTQLILEAKEKKALTFLQIAEAAGCSEVYCTAAIYGQQTLSTEQAEAIAKLLDLPEKAENELKTIPFRGVNFSMRQPTRPSIVCTKLYSCTAIRSRR